MYVILEIFKQEQAHTEVSIAQLDVGCQTPKRPNKYIDKDYKIEILKDRLRQDSITLMEYLSTCVINKFIFLMFSIFLMSVMVNQI